MLIEALWDNYANRCRFFLTFFFLTEHQKKNVFVKSAFKKKKKTLFRFIWTERKKSEPERREKQPSDRKVDLQHKPIILNCVYHVRTVYNPLNPTYNNQSPCN